MEYPSWERRRFGGGFVYLATHAALTSFVVGVALIGLLNPVVRFAEGRS